MIKLFISTLKGKFEMESNSWYEQLKKPPWAPPAWLFGPVWSILYVIIFISFGFTFYHSFTGMLLPALALPFAFNLIFNVLFTPIQFGIKNNYLAAVDILLVLVTLLWALISIFSYYPWVAFINIPYMLWVSFATILQINITLMNAN